MAERDDFSGKVRQALALRAGYLCSFAGCSQLTAGPSDESPMATAQVGVAAHICAAAPGGKRYDPSMTSDERAHIDNAIWMCATHATLIDRDEATYTVDGLRAMKASHEARVGKAIREKRAASAALPGDDLVALGPHLVCTGKVVGAKGHQWKLLLTHYVIGEIAALISFGENFSHLPPGDRYVLIDFLGDGRLMTEPPKWERTAEGLMVELDVAPDAPRTRAEELGTDLALGPDGDLEIKNGDLALVSGVQALPQMVQLCLWNAKGALPWATDFGHRLAEYFALYRDSPWFDRLVKLELIRLASIPYFGDVRESPDMPLRCVQRVIAVDITGPVSEKSLLPARVEFEVAGVGRWNSAVSLYVGANDDSHERSPGA
jgi:hypothetical protein